MAAGEPHSVGDILDTLDALGRAAGQETVHLRDMAEAMGNRSYGPLLVMLPLIELSPIGGIPGIPTFLATAIALIAVQMLVGRRHLRLPGMIGNRGVRGARLHGAVDRLRGLGGWMDRWFHGRLPVLTRGPAVRIAAAACIVLAATVPPLEVLPFASSAPMLAIAAFGLALTVRDGVLMAAAGLLATGALGVGIGLWSGAGGS